MGLSALEGSLQRPPGGMLGLQQATPGCAGTEADAAVPAVAAARAFLAVSAVFAVFAAAVVRAVATRLLSEGC